MDNLRGNFDSSDLTGDGPDWDGQETEYSAHDLPPEAIGQDERRMQVRAYNHWASLLGDGTLPSIEDLEPHNLDDFGPNSVLLDFSAGIEDPAVQYLGGKLAEECGTHGSISQLSDVPPRSLLSRITDHYMQILANEAPIGFEAEFVNQRGASIMYRGILLPFSSNGETIDFIYGVINWKEIADQVTSDELLLDLDQALEVGCEPVEDEDEPHKHHSDPLVDAPSADIFELGAENEVPDAEPLEAPAFDPVASLVAGEDGDGVDEADNVASFGGSDDEGYESPVDENDLPLPDFGQYSLEDPDEEDEEEDGANYSFASLSDYIETPSKKVVDLDADKFDPADYEAEYAEEDAAIEPVAPESAPVVDLGDFLETPPSENHDHTCEAAAEVEPEAVEAEPLPTVAPQVAFETDEEPLPVAELGDDAGLYDFLASAREMAQNAKTSEDRSRDALYEAVGRAYDFSLAAMANPAEYEELVSESGLTMQDRAPMTPVVKLVFGHDYDKTRLTEYAAVLSHAHRLELERGSLSKFLADADGGLKGVVAAERRLRREENGKQVEKADEVRRALADKLRELEALTFDALSSEGAEFSLVMVRRDGKGGISMVGEIDSDIALIERAARKIVG